MAKYGVLPTVKDVALAMQKDNVPKAYQSFVFSRYRYGTPYHEWVKDWDGDKWVKAME